MGAAVRFGSAKQDDAKMACIKMVSECGGDSRRLGENENWLSYHDSEKPLL